MEHKSIPELLAPAGSMEALKAAVNAGADAVYISGKRFGARFYSENFNELQMKETIDYAHLRDIKVYVTVNTLVKEFELEKVAEYLLFLYQLGNDAVILQDIGVASLCRELAPDMDMHASTQMSINSLEGVKWAHDFGFKRVVLARELSLPEIDEIVQIMGKKIELEIFIHGALCYSYSGQCLLSSVIGGRSGNRGRCAQPCRKPYQLLQGDQDNYGKLTKPNVIPTENYLLSTRDLALYGKLKDISKLNLDSLKIEGRMRSPEYVAIVVSIYREALNAIMQGNWVPDKKDIINLKLAFNRGFSNGYMFKTNKKSVMGRESPGNRGMYLGTVLSSEYIDKSNKSPKKSKNRHDEHRKIDTIINLDSKLEDFRDYLKLEKGDGFLFIRPGPAKTKYGIIIENNPEYLKKSLQLLLKTKIQVPTGSEVYLTRDSSLLKKAEGIIRSDVKKISIPLDIIMSWDKEKKPILDGNFKGKNGKKHEIHFESDFKMEPAIKSPLSREKIINQLKKTGGTPFKVRDMEINYPGNLFTPLSKLNRIRREFINQAELKLLNDYMPSKMCVESAWERWVMMRQDFKLKKSVKNNSPMELAVYTSSLETISGALRGGCKRVYFEPFLGGHYRRKLPCEFIGWKEYVERIQDSVLNALELCIAEDAHLIWKWPSINREIYLKNLLPLIKPLSDEGINEIMVDNVGALRVINNLNLPINTSGSVGLNVWNHRTVCEFSSVLSRLTLSNELSKKELASVMAQYRNNGQNTSFDFIVQGNLESMVSEDCLLKEVFKEKYMQNGFWGIEDVKNRVFPVMIDDEGRTHISNSVELCLIDYIPDLCELGFQHLVIEARNKTRKYAKKMASLYHQGLDFQEKTHDNLESLNKLKIKIKKISQGGITTGNFLKGLKENV